MSPPQLGMGASRTPERLGPEVLHPVGFALHPGHLVDEVLVDALLGLEDVVLLVAPAELVLAEVEADVGGCHGGSHSVEVGISPMAIVTTPHVRSILERTAYRHRPPTPGLDHPACVADTLEAHCASVTQRGNAPTNPRSDAPTGLVPALRCPHRYIEAARASGQEEHAGVNTYGGAPSRILLDASTRITSIDGGLANELGHGAEDLLEGPFSAIVAPGDIHDVGKDLIAIINGDKPVVTARRSKLQRADGTRARGGAVRRGARDRRRIRRLLGGRPARRRRTTGPSGDARPSSPAQRGRCAHRCRRRDRGHEPVVGPALRIGERRHPRQRRLPPRARGRTRRAPHPTSARSCGAPSPRLDWSFAASPTVPASGAGWRWHPSTAAPATSPSPPRTSPKST